MDCLDVGSMLFLAVVGFIAAFFDSVVGGGGLISLPALLCTGLSPVCALGTNKIAASMGTCISFFTFWRSGKMDWNFVKKLIPVSFIGSMLGVLVVCKIPPDFLRPIVIVLLIFVALYSIFKKDWGKEARKPVITARRFMLSLLMAFILGFYDGFFGPGTGSFLLFSFLMIGFDFLGAVANTKALNFASNISAMMLFAYLGEFSLPHALTMGFFMVLGAYVGANFALKKGVGYIRPLFIV